MAADLKRFFDRALVARIGDDIARAWPAFPTARFVDDASRELPSLELMARAQRIADAPPERRAQSPPRPGRRDVALRINGAAHPLGSFEVT